MTNAPSSPAASDPAYDYSSPSEVFAREGLSFFHASYYAGKTVLDRDGMLIMALDLDEVRTAAHAAAPADGVAVHIEAVSMGEFDELREVYSQLDPHRDFILLAGFEVDGVPIEPFH